jgi:hypothetical protein
MPPVAPPPAAAAELESRATVDTSNSGTAVLATFDLVERICRDLGSSAADGASLRQSCKQAAASLDWFDLMWCARADIPKVQAATNQHATITVPVARISRVIENSLSELWSCPPLLKWVVLQAAQQGDAELLGVVLGKQQQQQQEEGVLQPEASLLLEREQQQQSQWDEIIHNEKQFCRALLQHADMLGEPEYPSVLHRTVLRHGRNSEGCTIWLTVIAAEEAVCSSQVKLLEGWFQQAPTISGR